MYICTTQCLQEIEIATKQLAVFFRPWIQADINRWRFPLLPEETLEATKCCLRCPFGWEWQALHDRSRSTDGSHPSILVTLDAWDVDVGDLESEVDKCWYEMTWYVYTKKAIMYIHHGGRLLQRGSCNTNQSGRRTQWLLWQEHAPTMNRPALHLQVLYHETVVTDRHTRLLTENCVSELPQGYGGYV